MMVLRLLLQVICVYSVRAVMVARGVSVRVVLGGPGGQPCGRFDVNYEPCEVAITRALYKDCEPHLTDLPESLFSPSSSGGQRASFEVVYSNGVIRFYMIQSLCEVYRWCNKCGNNGKCRQQESTSQCVCEAGFRGRWCEKVANKAVNVITWVTVLVGLVVVIILVAAILNMYLKRRNKAAQASMQGAPSAYGLGQGTIIIKPARGSAHPAQVRCVPAGGLSTDAAFPFGHMKRQSTVKITELPDDYTPQPGEVVRPTVYTSIPTHTMNYDSLYARNPSPATNLYDSVPLNEGGTRVIIRPS